MNYSSVIEHSIIRSAEPIPLPNDIHIEYNKIANNHISGIWLNKSEEINWNAASTLPISEYSINNEKHTIILKKYIDSYKCLQQKINS